MLTLLGVACGSSSKKLYVDITKEPASRDPHALSVAVFDERGLIGQRERFEIAGLPGTLVVRGPWSGARSLRLSVLGFGDKVTLGGSARAVVSAEGGADARLQVVLSELLRDGDGDQVVDEIDNCASLSNADQADADGDGVGDACAGADAGVDLAGPPDLAGTDLAGSAPGCPTAGTVLLCDDFETGQPRSSWSKVESGGTATVDTTRAHSGGASLHIQISADSSVSGEVGAKLVDQQLLPSLPTGTELWVRAYYYVTSVPPDHVNLVSLTQSGSPWGSIDLYLTNGGELACFTDLEGGMGGYSQTALPLSKWNCVEEHLTLGPGPVSLSLDGTVLPSTPAPVTLTAAPAPSLKSLVVGYSYYDGALTQVPALEVWVDDVIVDTKPIGCSP